VYHKPCNVVVEVSGSYVSFLCLACGTAGSLRGWEHEIGVRVFSDYWIQNPSDELPPLQE